MHEATVGHGSAKANLRDILLISLQLLLLIDETGPVQYIIKRDFPIRLHAVGSRAGKKKVLETNRASWCCGNFIDQGRPICGLPGCVTRPEATLVNYRTLCILYTM